MLYCCVPKEIGRNHLTLQFSITVFRLEQWRIGVWTTTSNAERDAVPQVCHAVHVAVAARCASCVVVVVEAVEVPWP